MQLILELLQLPLAHRVGWVLLHSLWQGALVAVVFGLIRLSLRRFSARARYLAGCLGLLLFAAAPVITFCLLRPDPQTASERTGHVAIVDTVPTIVAAEGIGSPVAGRVARPFISQCAEFLDWTIPWLVAAWMIGVALFSFRLAQGCWRLNSLRTDGLEPLDSCWIAMLDELKQRLNISRPVRLFKSALVEVPTVIGWLRPFILLPASSLTGLTPSQLESILAHELAHVVRHDYLVNLFQSVVETLMFYHPAVWWISRCIREEREHCCDDLAVQVCGDCVVYASALATMEELRSQTPQLAFAASGGSLLNRVRRLAGFSDESPDAGGRQLGGLALLGIGIVLVIFGVCLMLAPPRFQAVTRIKINREPNQPGLADEKQKIDDSPFFLQTEASTIESPLILNRVVETKQLNQEWGRKYNRGLPFKTSEATVLLRSRVSVKPVPNMNLVQITVFSDNAAEAADLANGIAEAYREHRSAQTFETMSNVMAALRMEWDNEEERVRQVQSNVDRLRVELKISDADAAGPGPTPTLSIESQRQLQSEFNNLKAFEVSQATALKKLTNLPVAKLREVVQIVLEQPDAELSNLMAQSDVAQENLIKMAASYSSDHPNYITARKLIEEIDRRIDARVEGILIGLQTKLDKTRATLSALSERLENARTNDLAMAERTRPYFMRHEQLIDLLEFKKNLQTRLANMKADLSLPRPTPVEIIDRAASPLQPLSNNQSLGLGLVILGGLLGCVGIVMMRRKSEESLT